MLQIGVVAFGNRPLEPKALEVKFRITLERQGVGRSNQALFRWSASRSDN